MEYARIKDKILLRLLPAKTFKFLKFEIYKGDIIDQEIKRDKKIDYIKPEILFGQKYSHPDKEYATH